MTVSFDEHDTEQNAMIKVVTLLTKKSGMSRQAFVDHYETYHSKIGEKYLSGYAVKYQRRYVNPLDATEDDSRGLPFDVLMEIWFPDRERMEAAMALITSESAQEEIVADEERLFDRDKICSFVVDEYESVMPDPAPIGAS